jgi:hypothetical protein
MTRSRTRDQPAELATLMKVRSPPANGSVKDRLLVLFWRSLLQQAASALCSRLGVGFDTRGAWRQLQSRSRDPCAEFPMPPGFRLPFDSSDWLSHGTIEFRRVLLATTAVMILCSGCWPAGSP